MSDTCRSCQARIRWVITEKGKRMPLDYDPVLGGNVIPVQVHIPGPFTRTETRAQVIEPDPERSAWVSHFTTCPHSRQHRKARA